MEHPISLLQSAPRGVALSKLAAQYAEAYGYPAHIENGHLTVGYAIHASFLLVVTGDISGAVTALEVLRSMPPRHRGRVSLLLYPKRPFPLRCRDCGNIALHLQDVACADAITFAVTEPLWQDIVRRNSIAFCVGCYGKKTIAVRKKPLSVVARRYRSGVCVSAYGAKGKEKIADRTNINLLRAVLVSLIVGENLEEEK